MGVVNVTPDSFFDGGRFFDAEKAIQHGVDLAKEGADILDVGGESTRPGAESVDAAEELRRVLPVVRGLVSRTGVAISIDTQKPEVAEAALAAGAVIVNDIAASRADDAMARILADTGAGYICMHMRGTPKTMQVNPVYADVVSEVQSFFSDRLLSLQRAGVPAEQVALDVGIGFGKSLEHNLRLLAAMESFRSFIRPLVLGVSRKSFMGRLLGAEVEDRLPASLACAVWGVQQGIQVIRTHDVSATRQAVRMVEALQERK